MRIAAEAGSLLPPRTGVGRSTFELVRAMLRQAREDDEIHLVWRSLRRELDAGDVCALAGARLHAGRFPSGPALLKLWQHLRWPPIERFSGPVDLAWGPAGFLPPSRARARVLTVMDLHFLRHPEHTRWMGGRLLARHLPRAVHRATRILVPSEATARECTELLGVERGRMTVTPLGGAEQFSQEPTAEEMARFDLLFPEFRGNPPWLMVGVDEPRKNFALVRHAQALLGPKSVPALRIGPDTAPRVDDTALRCALRRARGLIMPSLNEGFGLPVIEAMASGCPVLCSAIPVFHEITGEHARFFDPRDPESLAEQLRQALADPGAERRRAERARTHADQFTWERTAALTWETLRGV